MSGWILPSRPVAMPPLPGWQVTTGTAWPRTNADTFHFQPANNFAVWPDMRAALLDF
jgi:hypothetical protein